MTSLLALHSAELRRRRDTGVRLGAPAAAAPPEPAAAAEAAQPLSPQAALFADLGTTEQRVLALLVALAHAGDALPTTRELADRLWLQPGTIGGALAALEAKGRIVVGRNRTGPRLSVAVPLLGLTVVAPGRAL